MPDPCPSHHTYPRLLADLHLVEQLRAIASCMPCDWPTTGQLSPDAPIAQLLNQVADLLEHTLTTTDWLTQLAARMRAVRLRAGLSGKELAETLGWAPSKISRLEHGRQTPKARDIESWVRACSASAETAAELWDLLGKVHTRPHQRSGEPPAIPTPNNLEAS